MGLFGSKNQTPSISLEEALLLDDAEKLTSEGLRGLDVDWGILEGRPICKYQQKGWWYNLGISSIKSLKNKMIPVSKLFEVAEQKGSAMAAFLLGVIYEHGIGLDSPDFGEAEKHYKIADYRGCKLAELVSVLRTLDKVPVELQRIKQESLALGMLAVCREDDAFGELVWTNYPMDLSEEEQKVLLQLGTYLMYYYAERNCPVSLAFAQTNSELYKTFLAEGKTHKYNMVKGSTSAEDLNKRLKNLVIMGDPLAIAVCQALEVKFYE